MPTTVETLSSEGWETIYSGKEHRILKKGDERILYNHKRDLIIRRYDVRPKKNEYFDLPEEVRDEVEALLRA